MLIIGNGVSDTYESYYDMLYRKSNNKEISESIALLYYYIYTQYILKIYSGEFTEDHTGGLTDEDFKKTYNDYFQNEFENNYSSYRSKGLISFYAMRYTEFYKKILEEGHSPDEAEQTAKYYTRTYSKPFVNGYAEAEIEVVVLFLKYFYDKLNHNIEESSKTVSDLFDIHVKYIVPVITAIEQNNYNRESVKKLLTFNQPIQ